MSMKAILFAAAAVGLGYYSFTSGESGQSSIDGLTFPLTIRMGGTTQTLIGGGTRFKYGAVKVYAAALYLDNSGISTLKNFKGRGAASLVKEQPFFDAIAVARLTKTMLLRFHRSVGAPAVVEALRDALKPKLSEKVVTKFEKLLSGELGDTVAKDSQIFLTCKGDSLYISTAESTGPRLSEKSICPALFEVYLGKTPVSQAIKSGVATGFANL